MSTDTALRLALRAVKASPDSETRAAYRLARERAGLPTLPPYSPAHQRERLMRIFEGYASDIDYNWAEGYAGRDKDETPHGIIAANWNHGTSHECRHCETPMRYDYRAGVNQYMPVVADTPCVDADTAHSHHAVVVHTPMSWLGAMFERLPASERPEMDWSDTTSLCGGCNLLIDTEYHGGYMVTDGDILCQDCCLDDLEAVIGYNASDRTIARELDRAPGWFQAAWREHKRAERDEEQGFTLEGQDTKDCERCAGKGKTSWRLTGGGMSNEHRCYDCNGSGQVDIETGEAA